MYSEACANLCAATIHVSNNIRPQRILCQQACCDERTHRLVEHVDEVGLGRVGDDAGRKGDDVADDVHAVALAVVALGTPVPVEAAEARGSCRCAASARAEACCGVVVQDVGVEAAGGVGEQTGDEAGGPLEAVGLVLEVLRPARGRVLVLLGGAGDAREEGVLGAATKAATAAAF
jgi:hypothetical protein